MNRQIATYGLTKQQLMLLEAALAEEYRAYMEIYTRGLAVEKTAINTL